MPILYSPSGPHRGQRPAHRQSFSSPCENFQMCHGCCPVRDCESIKTSGRIGTPPALCNSATPGETPARYERGCNAPPAHSFRLGMAHHPCWDTCGNAFIPIQACMGLCQMIGIRRSAGDQCCLFVIRPVFHSRQRSFQCSGIAHTVQSPNASLAREWIVSTSCGRRQSRTTASILASAPVGHRHSDAAPRC
jgi:hypothetical protein